MEEIRADPHRDSRLVRPSDRRPIDDGGVIEPRRVAGTASTRGRGVGPIAVLQHRCFPSSSLAAARAYFHLSESTVSQPVWYGAKSSPFLKTRVVTGWSSGMVQPSYTARRLSVT